MTSIFDTLMSLPLLKGVSPERLEQIVASIPLHFLKYPAGDRLIHAGAQSTHLYFIINGRVRLSMANPSGRFKVAQTLVGPDVIAPDYLFGRTTNFPCDVIALEPTGILQISKADYITMLRSDDVILFNYLNMLAAGAQSRIEGVLSLTDGHLEERIAYWIVALTQRSGRDIVLSCRQRDLYSFLGVQRSVLNATLQNLADRGIISYNATEIRATSRDALVKLLLNSDHE